MARNLADIIRPFVPKDADTGAFWDDIKYIREKTDATALSEAVCSAIRRRASLYRDAELKITEAIEKAIRYDGKVY